MSNVKCQQTVLTKMYGNTFTDSLTSSSAVRSNTATTLTWSGSSNSMYVGTSGHLPIPYSSFDPGPSTSSGYPPTSMFQFPPYHTMPLPFDYSQVSFSCYYFIYWTPTGLYKQCPIIKTKGNLLDNCTPKL